MVATKQDNTSAIIKVVQTVQIMSIEFLAKRENPHATGSAKRNCLSTDIIKDSNPPLSAWKIPWYAIFIPAKMKLREMILIALIQIDCVSPESPNNAENGTANISITAIPIIIMMIV